MASPPFGQPSAVYLRFAPVAEPTAGDYNTRLTRRSTSPVTDHQLTADHQNVDPIPLFSVATKGAISTAQNSAATRSRVKALHGRQTTRLRVVSWSEVLCCVL